MHPISEILCVIYNTLVAKGEVTFPLLEKQAEALDSIVKTVNSDYFSFERFPSLEEKATAYFVLIIKNHPVTDGNKRLAVLWLQFFCNTFSLKINRISLDILAIAVEKTPLPTEKVISLTQEIIFKEV